MNFKNDTWSESVGFKMAQGGALPCLVVCITPDRTKLKNMCYA